MSIFKWTEKQKYIDIITDMSLFLFLATKTGIIKFSIIEYVSLAIFILLIAYKIIKKGSLTMTKQSAYYTVFGIYACVSYMWSMDGRFSLETIPSIIALIVFIIAITNYIDSPQKFIKVVKYTVITNIIVSFKILILYYICSGTPADRINQITGIYFNTVAQVMGFSILFCIYLYQISSKKIYLLMTLPQFLAILLTESRKSLIIPILGIIIIMLFEKKTMKKLAIYMSMAIILVIGGLVVMNMDREFSNSMNEKFGELFKYVTGQETDDWSINLRQFFIETGIDIFKQHPIQGIGVNNFSYYVQKRTDYGVARYSHNNYIEMLSCLGLIGFVLYYWFYIYLIIKLVKRMIKDRTNMISIISLSAIIVLLIMEWGIVSYTGCMYHIYILIMYYTIEYGEKIQIKNKEESNVGQDKKNNK